MNFLNWCC